ncbi:Hypothetical Protein FCC1311_058412 [Hondaea fermentalgiana]|uniref:Uncharacterized protein n=1 Tax=Hondaea fermentalgiana TaxID=2315210 RepID=A0A2R5GFC2_9STRA|nr:Hypothetical Protein FCC1311_058412 [Hondaea fermentalgiana]|eukprot:GBG29620.1 Hypothetical Protein FCC1311_058412 [Hondaea fermentalgiana]
MQHAFAEAEERCSRFDGRAASARALVRKLREIVAQIHALHQTAPPSTLLEPLATKVLPALGDTQQDRNLARFVFLLLGIGVEALPQPSVVDDKETTEKSNALEIVKTLEHALVNQELGLNSPEWRRAAALRLFARLAKAKARIVAGSAHATTISLQVLWPHLIALCRTTSSVALQLEATKAMIWLANDKVRRSEAGGSSGRQIKALTTGFTKDAIGEVLQALEARVHYDPGLAWLLLDLAYSRYSNNPEGMGINSLFGVWRSCLERADGPVTHAVLRDLLALLDRPAVAGSYAALFGFLNEHMALFAKLEISDMPSHHKNDDDMNDLNGLEDLDVTSRPAFANFISGPIGNIAHRLVRSAFFDASVKVQQICAHALCRLAVLCPEKKHKDLENLLRYLAQQQGHFASSLGLLQTTLALLHAPPGIPEQHISALIDATLQISR